MKNTVFVTLILALFLAGCTSDMTEAEIKEKLIQANKDIKTYTLDMQLEMQMNAKAQGQEQQILSVMDYAGKVSIPDKKLWIKGVVTNHVGSENMSIDTETYMDGANIYVKQMGTWIKMQFSDTIWDSQNQIQQMLDLIDSGTLKRLPDEKANGRDFYVVELEPDINTLVDTLLKDQSQFGNMPVDIDFSDMIDSYKVKYWVDKETFRITKQYFEIQMHMTGENLGLTGADMDLDMTSFTKGSVFLKNINAPVKIVVPEEAYNGVSYEQLQKQILEAKAQAST